MTAPAVDMEALAGQMIPVAAAVACAVRGEPETAAAEIGELLGEFTRQDLYGLAVVLAAMVDVDSPVADLLAWVKLPVPWREPPCEQLSATAREGRQPCGTRGAYQRHVRQGTPPCQPCKDAEAAYQAARRRGEAA